ncbi:Ubiquinol-cytochrome C reductase, cytochrome B subunit [hydrothermal vent metagenome]|uniref:Ubiquinol-cytochrome C reductase, cytochrome B subunit n=1 Tax=hydrothermal vent metagenome TaxID=652676 RepID=A0A3B0YPB7_9ZZZZ
MNKHTFILLLLGGITPAHASAENSTPAYQLLENYASQGVHHASAEQGRIFWQKKFIVKGKASGSAFPERSCTDCHTANLKQSGKHIKTGKAIKPMSPALNPKRLTDIKKIKKWFKRNCKWTLGRECTAQEKTDVLAYFENS